MPSQFNPKNAATDILSNSIPEPPKRRIQSDRVSINVRADGKVIPVGELDNFTANKTDTIKKFKPVGETRYIHLLEDGDWEISFSGGKVDWHLARLLHRQETLFNHRKTDAIEGLAGALNDVLVATVNNVAHEVLDGVLGGLGEFGGYANQLLFGSVMKPPLDMKKVRYVAPKFEIMQRIQYYNGSYEIYIWEDVIIYGYSLDINGDLGELKESVKAVSPKQTRSDATFIIGEVLNPAQKIVDDMIKLSIQNDAIAREPGSNALEVPFKRS